MGQSYSNPDSSPEPNGNSIELKWRNDIFEYDTSNYFENVSKVPFFREDLEVMMGRIRRLPSFKKSSEASLALSIALVLLLNVAPIYFYIAWNVKTNGKYLWILSLLPIYIGLNALLPLMFNGIQNSLIKRGKAKRNKEMEDELKDMNEKIFKKRKVQVTHQQDKFTILITKS